MTPLSRFEELILPYLDEAYNLARWLTRNPDDAEDVVQEAFVRAFRFFNHYHGGSAKAWLFAIVRNTCYTWLKQNRRPEIAPMLEEEGADPPDTASNPDVLLAQSATRELLRQAIDAIPLEFREVIVLRDIEGFSYKEMADITGLPMGTVMSRLSRARTRLQQWFKEQRKEIEREL